MHRLSRGLFLPALAFAAALAWCPAAACAQGAAPAQAPSRDVPNYEVQLYLLVGSNDAGRGGELPRQLDAVVKQLKGSLPFAGYRLGATFLNRVRNAGTLSVNGVIPSPLTTPEPLPKNATYYEFRLEDVRLADDAAGQRFVNLSRLTFGMRLPVQTGTAPGEGGKAGAPVVEYQGIGITTQLSVPEGEPTVVGTITTSRPDESLVLVSVIKRASR